MTTSMVPQSSICDSLHRLSLLQLIEKAEAREKERMKKEEREVMIFNVNVTVTVKSNSLSVGFVTHQ